MSGDFDRVRDQLVSVAAELDDIVFDKLREAVADGATERPAWDREVAKARRAIEKAIAHLDDVDA